MARLVARFPFLGWPIIGPFFVRLATKYTIEFIDESSKTIKWVLIDEIADSDNDQYKDAVNKVNEVNSKPDPTPEEIENALKDLENALDGVGDFRPVRNGFVPSSKDSER